MQRNPAMVTVEKFKLVADVAKAYSKGNRA
jgi:hypothetical protein